jgi:ketosteroid isomerase-like protein
MSSEQRATEKLRAANTELARQFLDALNDNMNAKTLRELLAEDFVLTFPFAPAWFPSRYEGREAALHFLKTVVAGFLQAPYILDVTLDTFVSNPNRIMAEYRSDTFSKAVNQPYRNTYVSMFTVSGGKITEFIEYFGACAMIAAIGGKVEPPPTASPKARA